MERNYRLIIILLFLCIMSLIASACKSSKSSCDAYGVYWENPRIDSLGVNRNHRVYIPFIPVLGATQFHINTSEKGIYQVLLKEGNVVVEEKSFVLK